LIQPGLDVIQLGVYFLKLEEVKSLTHNTDYRSA
jgi:hypothetical protein